VNAPKMKAGEIEALAETLGIGLKPGNSEIIATMLSEIRQNVYRTGSALRQDTPLALYFDAR
jgi:hypothetical protein